VGRLLDYGGCVSAALELPPPLAAARVLDSEEESDIDMLDEEEPNTFRVMKKGDIIGFTAPHGSNKYRLGMVLVPLEALGYQQPDENDQGELVLSVVQIGRSLVQLIKRGSDLFENYSFDDYILTNETAYIDSDGEAETSSNDREFRPDVVPRYCYNYDTEEFTRTNHHTPYCNFAALQPPRNLTELKYGALAPVKGTIRGYDR